jgi:hypothetical protein
MAVCLGSQSTAGPEGKVSKEENKKRGLFLQKHLRVRRGPTGPLWNFKHREGLPKTRS